MVPTANNKAARMNAATTSAAAKTLQAYGEARKCHADAIAHGKQVAAKYRDWLENPIASIGYSPCCACTVCSGQADENQEEASQENDQGQESKEVKTTGLPTKF